MDKTNFDRKDYMKEYRKINKEKLKEYNKKYYKLNKEKIKEHKKEYNKLNKNKIKEYTKEYRENNKDKIKENYQINTEKIKEYRKNNKKHYNEYNKNRRKTDINFKILTNLRTRICKAIKNNSKSTSTRKLIGCTINELKNHLEKQFKKDMSWDNYGKWHIDHIKPCKLFDLSKPEEQKKCFYYSNLQPLWAVDNLQKGCKSDNKLADEKCIEIIKKAIKK